MSTAANSGNRFSYAPYSEDRILRLRRCRTQIHRIFCVQGDVIVFALDPKPSVFATDNPPRPADKTNNFLLFGLRQNVPPQIPYHYQRLSFNSKFPLPHSPV